VKKTGLKIIQKFWGLFQKRGSFEALSRPRLYPYLRGGKTINDDLSASLSALREIARDQEQNNPYVKRYLNLIVTNVIGSEGIQLSPNFHDARGNPLDEINLELKREFVLWSERETAEVTQKFSFRKVQEICLRALKRDGEVFVRFLKGWENPFGFTLQILMSQRVDETYNQDLGDGRKIVAGIELDSYGRRSAYYVIDEAGVRMQNGKKMSRVPASEIIHLYDPQMADAERGYSDLSASVNKLRMLHGCDEAQLTTMRVTAAKMGWLERTGVKPGQGVNDEDEDIEIYEAEPGMIKELPAGYTIKETNWGSYDGDPDLFRKGQLKGAAAGLSVNYSDLAMDYSDVNYTSLRAAYLSDRDAYAILQKVMIDGLCQPVFEEWLKMAVLKGRFKRIRAESIPLYLKPRWRGRGWEWVDPMKESVAAENLLKNNLISEEELISKRGGHLEDIYKNLSSAKKLRERYGIEDHGQSMTDGGKMKHGA